MYQSLDPVLCMRAQGNKNRISPQRSMQEAYIYCECTLNSLYRKRPQTNNKNNNFHRNQEDVGSGKQSVQKKAIITASYIDHFQISDSVTKLTKG